jgi:hypothetical protein
MTLSRFPGAGQGVPDSQEPWPIATLSQDHHFIPIRTLERCEVGQHIILILDLLGDGIPTIRATTPVTEIRSLGTPVT